MNLLKILDRLSDDKFFTTESTRAESFSQVAGFGKKAALAGIPIGLSSMFATNAKAETTSVSTAAAAPASAITDVLQFALTLEYLENEFYQIGLGTNGLIPAADRAVFEQIYKHETSHIAFIKGTLNTLNEAPGAKPTFDFTGGPGGLALDTFTNYQTFLVLAQAFEDTGVRAFKGQAGNLASNKAVLTAALQIHSVEARHASQVRRMRAQKGWIENSTGGNMPAITDSSYAGEGLTVQAGYNTAATFGAAAGSASFDEILTKPDVLMIASTFIV